MSSKDIKIQSDSLLELNWEQEEKDTISRLVKQMIDYRMMIPGYLKEDILSLLKLANKLRRDYEELLKEKSDFSPVI
jgi:hypothetical protein